MSNRAGCHPGGRARIGNGTAGRRSVARTRDHKPISDNGDRNCGDKVPDGKLARRRSIPRSGETEAVFPHPNAPVPLYGDAKAAQKPDCRSSPDACSVAVCRFAASNLLHTFRRLRVAPKRRGKSKVIYGVILLSDVAIISATLPAQSSAKITRRSLGSHLKRGVRTGVDLMYRRSLGLIQTGPYHCAITDAYMCKRVEDPSARTNRQRGRYLIGGRMPLINQLANEVPDRWIYPEDGKTGSFGPFRIVSVDLVGQLGTIPLNSAPTGVLLAPDSSLQVIAPFLVRIGVVVIPFAGLQDGKGFTLARVLREYHGYNGDIRAIGHVLPDQLPLLVQCGFTSIMTPPEHPPVQWRQFRGTGLVKRRH